MKLTYWVTSPPPPCDFQEPKSFSEVKSLWSLKASRTLYLVQSQALQTYVSTKKVNTSEIDEDDLKARWSLEWRSKCKYIIVTDNSFIPILIFFSFQILCKKNSWQRWFSWLVCHRFSRSDFADIAVSLNIFCPKYFCHLIYQRQKV